MFNSAAIRVTSGLFKKHDNNPRPQKSSDPTIECMSTFYYLAVGDFSLPLVRRDTCVPCAIMETPTLGFLLTLAVNLSQQTHTPQDKLVKPHPTDEAHIYQMQLEKSLERPIRPFYLTISLTIIG
uniref:Uncharacterized protein n=1 Tax=Mesocestoides corti TaxID=53468 RepID=A0A5K3FX02_MESCO